MTNSQRRIALLTGASLAALGLATPSFAAPHDVLLPGGDQTNPGTSTNDPLIDLCTLAAATPECFYGEIDTGGATAFATVTSTADGQIVQADNGPSVTLEAFVSPGDTAEIGAIAVATAGNVNAGAQLTDAGFFQTATGTTGNAIVALEIESDTVAGDGRLLIDALAVAIATTANANADASIQGGVSQNAYVGAAASGIAVAAIANAGSLTVAATATAIADNYAYASADNSDGILQYASNQGTGGAVAFLSNDGQLNVLGNAFASGTSATAYAEVETGISQQAYADTGTAAGAGFAIASVDNGTAGSINIQANATALAAGNTTGDAYASASATYGIYQYVSNSGTGLAEAAVRNAGTIDIEANAFASAASDNATAYAYNYYGISQYAYANSGSAIALIDNDAGASLDIAANADAIADTYAFAYAYLYSAISQSVTAYTTLARAEIANDGNISLMADAFASGTSASATAYNYYAINQSVEGSNGADATGIIANGTAGTIDIGAVAVAVGTASAEAYAYMSSAISQSVSADTGGNALAAIDNLGTININATAVASASDASATAYNYYAIQQDADASTGGDATARISNGLGATLDIGAVAVANGVTSGYAYASLYSAITQEASASSGGDALATIANAGLIDLHATAVANGTYAQATAYNSYAISQSVSATSSGDATARIDNDAGATLNIAAVAVANGLTSADAYASVYSAISQSVSATSSGLGLAEILNDGTLNINATAVAVGSDASATAYNYYAIQQSVSGDSGGAIAAIVNGTAGTIDIGAVAVASGLTDAYAYAYVYSAISQSADADSGGLALVEIDNAGSLNIHATAVATGSSATASAYNYSAIYQEADASQGGTASAVIANGTLASIDIGAVAVASGASSVDASAYVSNAISQSADAATSGNAVASILNDGSIAIHATASAVGTLAVDADATVQSAITQYAFADSGNATARFGGAGTVDIDAVALAISTTGEADAYAEVSYGLYQYVTVNTGVALASADLGGMSINAQASALGSTASATAYIYDAIDQYADVNVSGTASAMLVNSGDLEVRAAAFASATRDSAFAYATVDTGIAQSAINASGDALVTLINDGTIDIGANATAIANDYAYAYASVDTGISQYASAVNGDALVALINAPALTIEATAFASGNSATATATVNLGITQSANAFGGSAAVVIDNADPITISADAEAIADVNDGYAYAYVDTGIYQSAQATGTTGLGVGYNAEAVVLNGTAGAISVFANADAVGVTYASASATVGRGIDQFASATAGTGAVLIDNDGAIAITAVANASADTGAYAYASVFTGIDQDAIGGTGALAEVLNDGSLEVGAMANAVAAGFATATAVVYGISQNATTGTAAIVNGTAGSIDVHATATATASSGAAGAYAYGAFQTAALVVLDNQGDYNVNALANANVSSGTAYASAQGIGGFNIGTAATLSVDYVNGGLFNVSAVAVAPSTASAYALGMSVESFGPTAAVATHEQLLTGAITNSGDFVVLASAQGGGSYTTVTGGGATITVTQSVAQATGIRMESGTNNLTVTNSGLFSVDAVTAGNGTTTAIGIIAEDNGTGIAAPAGSLLTIVNDGGDIIVRESLDGGATWRRGMAIDVDLAPNPTVINLLGDGYIYGNIDTGTADVISVESGTTYFDGIINPEYVPIGGFTTADLDSSIAGDGDLIIQNDGNLILADDVDNTTMYDGPAYAIVDNFTVATDGTITFELNPTTGGTQPVGSYPQVYANNADLQGTLVADITPAGGLFFDEYVWENVIDAHVRVGGFDGAQCVLDGAYSGSLLVDLDCVEDGAANIDLVLTRAAFDSVPGLNQNGASVGAGLECIYDPTLTGGIADLLADLFLFTDPVNYNIALNQLAGEGYANYLQSFPSLGVHYNDLIDRATNCEVPALAGSILECRASAPLHLWGQLDYQWRKADGDEEAGTAKAKRFSGLIGLDANFGGTTIVGASIGLVNNRTRTGRFDEDVDGEGWQVGLYGAYDPGQFYVKAMTTYSWYDGDSSRRVDFNGLAPGATFAGQMSGDPDVNMWTFGLHGGYRIGMGGNSVLTPYLNYDYVNAKLKSFTESGLDGANLTVLGGRAKHSFLTGGVKWATQFGGVVPEVNLGYRYRFGDKRSSFDAAFIGDTACDFEVISAAQKRGSFLAGLSIGGKVGPVDLRIGYEGEFNSDITSHAGNFKIVIPLGGRAAPPPPAPVVAPPPPPPPAPEVAPPPPPPPPAPVERGERGQ